MGLGEAVGQALLDEPSDAVHLVLHFEVTHLVLNSPFKGQPAPRRPLPKPEIVPGKVARARPSEVR